jgi:hypothetical protein
MFSGQFQRVIWSSVQHDILVTGKIVISHIALSDHVMTPIAHINTIRVCVIYKHTPNYNIHNTENVTVDLYVSRYIWNIIVTYLDTLIHNVSRYVTASEHISI